MWIRKSVQTQTVLLFSLVSIAAGCGQNANIAKKNATASTSQLDKANRIPRSGMVDPDTLIQPDPEPSAKILPIATCPAPEVPAGPAPLPSIVVVVPPAVVVPANDGQKGKDGKDGRDGKDGITIIGEKGRDGCGVVEVAPVSFQALSTDPAYYSNKPLPYVATPRHNIDLIALGDTNRHNGGYDYVQDAMVPFEFQIKMPPRKSIKNLSTARLRMKVLKLSEGDFVNTELLCFMDYNFCSGQHFHANEGGWEDNVNPAFWSDANGGSKQMLPNEAFIDHFKTKKRNKLTFNWKDRNRKNHKFVGSLLRNDALVFNLKDLLKGSKHEGDLLSFLYGDTDLNVPLERTLHLVAADDTLITDVSLELQYKEDTCTTIQLQGPSAAAR
jgi:hypothetical protein